MHLCALCGRPWWPVEGVRTPGIGVTHACELPGGCWEPNWYPLEEQQACLTTEPFLQSLSYFLSFGLDSMCTGRLTTTELKSLSWDFGLYLAKHISHHYHVTCPPWSLPGTFLRPGTSLILALLATNRVSMLVPTCYRVPPAGGYETALFYSVYFML